MSVDNFLWAAAAACHFYPIVSTVSSFYLEMKSDGGMRPFSGRGTKQIEISASNFSKKLYKARMAHL